MVTLMPQFVRPHINSHVCYLLISKLRNVQHQIQKKPVKIYTVEMTDARVTAFTWLKHMLQIQIANKTLTLSTCIHHIKLLEKKHFIYGFLLFC